MYLLPEVNLQLRPRLLALAPGTRIVSHDWDLGDWRPTGRSRRRSRQGARPRQVLARPPVDRAGARPRPLVRRRREPRDRAALPALLGDARERRQRRARRGVRRPHRSLDLRSEGVHTVALRLDGETLHLLGSAGAAPARSFVRARGATCP
jgi:hypothetical protein